MRRQTRTVLQLAKGITFVTPADGISQYYITKYLINVVLDANTLSVQYLCSRKVTNLILAVLALLTAGLSCSVWQTAAGRGGLSVSVPVFVSKPGEGHTGGDGSH